MTVAVTPQRAHVHSDPVTFAPLPHPRALHRPKDEGYDHRAITPVRSYPSDRFPIPSRRRRSVEYRQRDLEPGTRGAAVRFASVGDLAVNRAVLERDHHHDRPTGAPLDDLLSRLRD